MRVRVCVFQWLSSDCVLWMCAGVLVVYVHRVCPYQEAKQRRLALQQPAMAAASSAAATSVPAAAAAGPKPLPASLLAKPVSHALNTSVAALNTSALNSSIAVRSALAKMLSGFGPFGWMRSDDAFVLLGCDAGG